MGNKAIISKDNILEVAFAIASEKGLVGLGIREVADACSVSVGSVYNYFPSKAHLISEVVGRYWEQALDKKRITRKARRRLSFVLPPLIRTHGATNQALPTNLVWPNEVSR